MATHYVTRDDFTGELIAIPHSKPFFGKPNSYASRGGVGELKEGTGGDRVRTGMVQYGRDDQNLVMFSRKSVHNAVKSEQAGRPVYDEVDFIRIQTPGDRLNIIERPVQTSDPQRWPGHWAAYKQGQEQTPIGTPIDLLFPQHPAIADNCRAVGIQTVEMLANLNDHGQSTLGMGALDYVNYAKQYLNAATKGVPFHQMQSELKQRDQQIANQQRQIEALMGQVNSLTQALASGVNYGTHGAAQVAPVMQPRPVQPLSMPPIPGGFDPQTSQINAVHESVEMAQNVAYTPDVALDPGYQGAAPPSFAPQPFPPNVAPPAAPPAPAGRRRRIADSAA